MTGLGCVKGCEHNQFCPCVRTKTAADGPDRAQGCRYRASLTAKVSFHTAIVG
jgi:hypothetical protein